MHEIVADLQRREKESGYIANTYDDDVMDGAQAGGQVVELRQAELPTTRDPKLWHVKCKDGAEAEVLAAIANKFQQAMAAGRAPGIFSALSSRKGAIFVEAYREANVKQALEGVTNVYAWRPGGIKLVPMPDMPNVLNAAIKKQRLKKGVFVRVARGMYKGDLAQVLDLTDGGAQATVRMVPRLDMHALSMTEEQKKMMTKRRRGIRAPQRFFDLEEIRAASQGPVEVQDRRMPRLGIVADLFKGETYHGGFLIKNVKVDYLTQQGADPTLDEMQQFKPRGEEEAGAAGAGTGLASATERQWRS